MLQIESEKKKNIRELKMINDIAVLSDYKDIEKFF